MLRTPPTPSPEILAGTITPAVLEKEPAQTNANFIPLQDTNLKLDEAAEAALVDHALARMEHIKYEMGLRDSEGRVEHDSWLDIRIRNEQTNANDVRWRLRLPDTVFKDSNFTRGNSKRHCRLYAARVRDDLIGTRPFFGAFAQDGTDSSEVQLAKDAEELAQQRIEASNIPGVIREGVRLAAIRNESVVKVTYSKRATPYIGPATVLVDPRTGMPARTPDLGLLVYKDDDVIEDPHAEGVLRLKKDPSFEMVDGQYETKFFPALEQTLVHEDNVRGEVLDPRDFLCPITAEDIHSADLVAHLREDTAGSLNALYAGLAQFEDYKRRTPVTGRLQPREHQNEKDEILRPYGLDMILIAECYLRYTIDGVESDVLLVIDVEARKAIFYDYMANHMSRRPFTVIFGVEREPNRWYGVGVYSMMEHNDLYGDGMFNRHNRADSQSGKIRWVAKQAVKEWRDNPVIHIGSPKPVTVDATWDSEKPIAGEINLNAIPENSQGLVLMTGMDQAGEQLFGIYGNADASAANLNNSRTATGVMNNERNSNVLLKDSEIDHIRSIEDILCMAVEFLLENIPTILFTMSSKTQTLITLNREEIRSLKRNVKLLLTRSKSAEALKSNQDAEAIALRYFRLTPLEQFYLRDFYVGQLRSLEIADADQKLPEVSREELQAWQQAEAQKAAPPQPPSQSISFKYEDLARSEQVQLLQKAGIQPASDEELALKKAEEQAAEVDMIEAKAKAAPKPAPNGKATAPAGRN